MEPFSARGVAHGVLQGGYSDVGQDHFVPAGLRFEAHSHYPFPVPVPVLHSHAHSQSAHSHSQSHSQAHSQAHSQSHSQPHVTSTGVQADTRPLHNLPEPSCSVSAGADTENIDSDLEPDVYFEHSTHSQTQSQPSQSQAQSQNGESLPQPQTQQTGSQTCETKGPKKLSRMTGYNLYCHEKSKETAKGFYVKEWAKSWAKLSASERQSYSRRAAQTKRVNVHNTLRKILTLFKTLEDATDTTLAVVGFHQDKYILDGFGPAYDALSSQSNSLRRSILRRAFGIEREEPSRLCKPSKGSGVRAQLRERLDRLAEDALGCIHFPYKKAERGEVIVEGVPEDLLPLKPPSLLSVSEVKRLLSCQISLRFSEELWNQNHDTDSSAGSSTHNSHLHGLSHMDSAGFMRGPLECEGHDVSALNRDSDPRGRDMAQSSGQNSGGGSKFGAKSGLHGIVSEHEGCFSSSYQASMAAIEDLIEDEVPGGYTLCLQKPKTWRLTAVRKKRTPKPPMERQRKEYVRHIWTVPEKEVLQRHFLDTLQRGRFPSKKEIQDVIQAEPLLHRRTWKKIDNFLRSQQN